jgi:hypothetical protein
MNIKTMRTLECAEIYPYDADDNDIFLPSHDWAEMAARGVVYDLLDRRNIKHGFNNVDEDVRREIIVTLADIIRTAKALN